MSIKVDFDTATREELVAEIERQAEMNARWASNWVTIVTANAEAWRDKVKEQQVRIDFLEGQLWVENS